MPVTVPPSPTYYTGVGAPSATLGKVGDSYLDTASQFLYSNTATGWVHTGQAVAQPTIGGVQIGTAGATGSIYAGFTMSVGDDFTGTSPDLVSHLSRSGKYFTTRVYVEPARGLEAPRGNGSLATYDSDPFFTGNNDSNRGIPLASYADLITQSNSAIALKARQNTTGTNEYAYAPSGQLQVCGAINTAGAMMAEFPCIIEARVMLTPPTVTSGVTAAHPSFWLMMAAPVSALSGIEIDVEANSGGTSFDFHGFSWPSTPGQASTELPDPALGNTVAPGLWDSQWHTYTFVISATQVEYFVDGQLVNTVVANMAAFGAKPHYALLTPHSASGQTWLTPMYMAVDWVRMWRRTGSTHWAPLASQPDLSATFGSAFSFALPPASGVWGAGVASDVLEAVPNSVRSPGGNSNGMYNGALLPPQITYSGGTLSGTVTDQPGRVNLIRHYTGSGDSCQPQRFGLNIGPRILTPSTVAAAIGTAYSHDVYADCDVGDLLPKSISVTGLPAGLTYIPAGVGGGTISGTPTALGSYTITVTNGVGQTASQTITLAAPTAGSGVTLPIANGLVGALDFDNLSLLTVAGGTISAAAGAMGTTAAATQATGASQPTSTKVGYRYAAGFSGAQTLGWTTLLAAAGSAAALTDAITILVIYKLGGTSTAECIVDIGQQAAGATAERAALLVSGGTIFRYGGTATNDYQDNEALTTNATKVLLRRPSSVNIGGSTICIVNRDGNNNATSTVQTANMGAPDTVTLGARTTAGAANDFLTGDIYYVAVFNRYLEDYENNILRAWAHAMYGTP